MATEHQNLSDHEEVPSASEMNFGIVVAAWNKEITDNLFEGCLATLLSHGATIENIHVNRVPGCVELPLGAQLLLENKKPNAIICLGSVIRGQTSHFDYVCQMTSEGIKDVGLKYNKPVIFGVLTDENKEQAQDRSGGKHGNKGDEAAVTAIKMVAFQQEIEG